MDKMKNCENCKHYVKHYYWFKDGLKNAHSGHCIGRRLKRLVTGGGGCEKWEIGEDRRDGRNKEFKTILVRAARQIEEIAALLNIEEIGAPINEDEKSPR